jgi:hypothetical protein
MTSPTNIYLAKTIAHAGDLLEMFHVDSKFVAKNHQVQNFHSLTYKKDLWKLSKASGAASKRLTAIPRACNLNKRLFA